MNSSDNEVLIRILTAYERGGVEEVKRDLADLNKKTDEQGKTAEGAHGKWRAWHHAIGGLAQLARGNLEGLGQSLHGVMGLLGSAGKAIFPLALVGLAVGAIAKVTEGYRKAAEASKEAAEAASDYAAKARDASADYGLSDRLREIDALKARYEAAATAAENLAKAQDKLRSAKAQLEIARLNDAEQAALGRAGTPEEKENVKMNFLRQRAFMEGQQEIENAQAKVDEADRKIAKAKGDQEVATLQANKLASEAARAAKEKEVADAALSGGGVNIAEVKDRQKKQAELEEEADKLKTKAPKWVKDSGIAGGHVEEDESTYTYTPENKAKASALLDAAEALRHYDAVLGRATTTEKAFREQQQKSAEAVNAAKSAAETATVEKQAAEVELNTAQTKAHTGERKAASEQQDAFRKQDLSAVEAERKAAEQQLKNDAKKLSGLAKDDTNQGNKGIANIDKGLREAASSGDTAKLLEQLHTAQKSGDKSVRDYAEKMLCLVEGVAADMAAQNARIARLEAQLKTNRNDATTGQ